MKTADTLPPLLTHLGQQVRQLRLSRNLSQQELARQAGVALGAVKSLETGRGATVRTLACVLQAMQCSEWLLTLHPDTSAGTRLRASKVRPPANPGPGTPQPHEPPH